MNTKELTDRLIQDINSSLLHRAKFPGVETQMAKMIMTGTPSSAPEFIAALNIKEFDDCLPKVALLINRYKQIVTYKEHAPINIGKFNQELIEKRVEIEQTFQKIIDDKNQIDLSTGKPADMGGILRHFLDLLHSTAGTQL